MVRRCYLLTFLKEGCGFLKLGLRMGVACADALIENLTVYEMLIYTAELKIPNTQSFQQKKDKVDAVINQLALNTCKNVRIGSTLSRGISGRLPC